MDSWQWSPYERLTRDELFAVLAGRQAVFIVEQQCAYQDADELDPASFHLIGWNATSAGRRLVAYARVVRPGEKYAEPSLGRILTVGDRRRTGLGTALTREAIARTLVEYPGTPIRISAQCYLESFYARFGFTAVSAPYDEDGIAHLEMLRPPGP